MLMPTKMSESEFTKLWILWWCKISLFKFLSTNKSSYWQYYALWGQKIQMNTKKWFDKGSSRKYKH